MRQIFSICLLFLFVSILHAQISTNEKPYGLRDNITLDVQKKVFLSPADLSRIEAEDLINDQQPGPIRYAYPIHVNFTLENSGTWQQFEDGSRIWRLKVNIPGALSTNAYFDKFWLPEGAEFYVYNENTKQSIGAITSCFIDGSKDDPIEFATAIIYGEDVVYEYFQPVSVKELPVILFSRIDWGYRFVRTVSRGFGDADSCSVNINCSEGYNWQNEKNALAKICVPFRDGSFCGSCALVNNTNIDNTPYVLTANHIIAGSNASQFVFYWDYEHPDCNNSFYEPTLKTTVGATVVANYWVSDFALLKIKSNQDPCNLFNFTPYYLGWDITGNSGTGGVCIHHPKGDVKKISTYDMSPINSFCANSTLFWDVKFVYTTNGHSTVQGGSSGSPLISSDRKVIGQLYGPYNDNICPQYPCNKPFSQQVTYGKFSVSWTGNNSLEDSKKLQPWLDSLNTGTTTLDGISLLGFFQGTLSGANEVQLCNRYTYSYNYSGSMPNTCQLRWKVSSDLIIISGQGTNSIVVQHVAKTSSAATLYLDIIRSGSVVKTKTKQINLLGSNTSYSNLSTEDFTVSTNTTWSGDKALGVKATVASGVTLTITGTIYSIENGKIIVEPGGKLVLNGGTLTSACPNEMWQGVTVMGDPTQPIGGTYQTTVQLLNGSKIENAQCALRVYDGGNIRASGSSSFVNNATGIKFESIAIGQTGISGSFTKVNFIINNRFISNLTDFEAHIIAQSCGSINVHGCNFSSIAPNTKPTKNFGINAFNTNLIVEEYCPGSLNLNYECDMPIEINSFTGFSDAIKSINSGTVPILKVWYSNFFKNLRGVVVEGINNHQLIRNNFSIPEYGPRDYTYGAHILNATGYRIEENDFLGARSNPAPSGLDRKSLGLSITNSGTPENEVYKNSFGNLAIGQLSYEINASSGIPYTGLQILCNTFQYEQNADILVGSYPGFMTPPTINRIRKIQGSTLTSAGNLFKGVPLFNNIDNFQAPDVIDYYHRFQPYENPPAIVHVNKNLSSSTNSCPSKVDLIIYIEKGFSTALFQYDAWNDLYEYWLALLATTSEDDEEYEHILQMVSYYSALKDNYFNGLIVSIMEEESRKQKAEGGKQSFDYAQLPKTEDDFYETLRFLFNYRNHYTDNLSIVETYLAESNFREALVALTNIYEQFELTEEQMNELTGLQTYIYWLQQLENEQNTIYLLSEREIEYLVSFVEENTGRGKVFANNILCGLYGVCIEEAEGRRQKAESDDEMMRGLDDEMMNIPLQALEGCPKGGVVERGSFLENITIAPNPTTGELTISPAGGGKGVEQLTIDNVEIFDIYGKCHLSLVTCHLSLVTRHTSPSISLTYRQGFTL